MTNKEWGGNRDLNKQIIWEWRRAQMIDLARNIFSLRRVAVSLVPSVLAACTTAPTAEVQPAPEVKQKTLFSLDVTKSRIIIEGRGNDSQWWLTSGGAVIIENGQLSTPHRETTAADPWYSANSGDEDQAKAKRPEIVQRAVTADIASESWSNYSVTTTITPTENIISDSPEVDGTDGIDLFLYFKPNENEGNLWYNTYVTYITKDGRLMIKKRFVGQDGTVYYGLLAEQKIIDGDYVKGQSLIPIGVPIRLSATIRNDQQSTSIFLQVEIPASQSFKGLHASISGTDDGTVTDEEGSGKALGNPYRSGRAGLRTDSLEFNLSKFIVNQLPSRVTPTP